MNKIKITSFLACDDDGSKTGVVGWASADSISLAINLNTYYA